MLMAEHIPLRIGDMKATPVVSERTKKQVQKAKLEIRNGALKGTTYILQRDPSKWLIGGRSQSADLHINDTTVSKEHFRVQMRGDTVVLQPLATSTGTFIGPSYGAARLPPLSEALLNHQAVFYAGKIRLRLTWLDHEEIPIAHETSLGGRLFGVSTLMRRLYSQIVRVAANDSDVLITGEVGTGKDETARLIHELSRRSSQPFVKIDCMEMGLDERLANIMIFGTSQAPGLLESAAGGVVYVDGIEEFSHALQHKLVAVIQNRVFRRSDETTKRPIDVRLVFSSRKDLNYTAQDRLLLPELFHRLPIVLNLPPLRHRLVDISILAPLFVEQIAEELGRKLEISKDGIAYLGRLPWPGNVLELRQFIHSVAVMTDAQVLSPDDFSGQSHTQSEIAYFEHQAGFFLEQAISSRLTSNVAKQAIFDEFTRSSMRIAIRKVGRSTANIAKLLGVTDRTIRNQMGYLSKHDQVKVL